ncbi:hypothetical protein [Streptomyces mirabilis]|uniref:hypothetical protein n=1 Tax=Streptomyces mirabilis TaxID=68239 RepID=UPI0036861C60
MATIRVLARPLIVRRRDGLAAARRGRGRREERRRVLRRAVDAERGKEAGHRRESQKAEKTEKAEKKDIVLAGASLMLLALVAHAGGDLGLTVTGPLFGLG